MDEEPTIENLSAALTVACKKLAKISEIVAQPVPFSTLTALSRHGTSSNDLLASLAVAKLELIEDILDEEAS